MNPIILVLFLIVPIAFSDQEKNNIEFSYKAQTRGFLYHLEVKNDSLTRDIDSNVSTKSLNSEQIEKFETLIDSINFETIKSNLDEEKLSVDAVIKGVLELKMRKRHYSFNLDHNKLPKEISILLSELQKF